jgi:hypothetical protein
MAMTASIATAKNHHQRVNVVPTRICPGEHNDLVRIFPRLAALSIAALPYRRSTCARSLRRLTNHSEFANSRPSAKSAAQRRAVSAEMSASAAASAIVKTSS